MNKKLPSEFDYNNDFNIMPTPPTLKARELDLFMTIIKRIVDNNNRTLTLDIDEVFEYIEYKGESLIEKLGVLSQFADKVLKWNIKYAVKDKNGARFYAFVCFEKMRSAIFADEYAEEGKNLFGMSNRTIEITAQKDFFEMIINKKFGWTRIDMKEYTWIRSKYAKKIYQLLKQWRSKGISPKIEWEEFKSILNIPENFKMCDIDKRILKPAIKELMEQHNLFENEELSHRRTIFENLHFYKVKDKKGRGQGGKVTDIYFTFTPQREQTAEERLKLENAKKDKQIEQLTKKNGQLTEQRNSAYRQTSSYEHQLGSRTGYEKFMGTSFKNRDGETIKILRPPFEFGGKIEVEFKNQEKESIFQRSFESENQLKSYIEKHNIVFKAW